MRWFTKRIEKQSGRQTRNSRHLSIESLEDRVCLTAMVIINDGSCGVEDVSSQTSYPCEVALMFEGDSLTWQESTGEANAVDQPHFPTEEETKELIKKLVAIVNSDPVAGIEGSDIGSGGLTSDPRADGTKDEPHFPTEEETKELIKKLVAIVNSDPVAGIEGSDIGSGGLTSDPDVDRSGVVRRSP